MTFGMRRSVLVALFAFLGLGDLDNNTFPGGVTIM